MHSKISQPNNNLFVMGFNSHHTYFVYTLTADIKWKALKFTAYASMIKGNYM